jgi:hypothetical protein
MDDCFSFILLYFVRAVHKAGDWIALNVHPMTVTGAYDAVAGN